MLLAKDRLDGVNERLDGIAAELQLSRRGTVQGFARLEESTTRNFDRLEKSFDTLERQFGTMNNGLNMLNHL